jgi:Cu+-exporting ATPase
MIFGIARHILIYAMVAIAVSVTAIFFNPLWDRPRLFMEAILGVGQPAGDPKQG